MGTLKLDTCTPRFGIDIYQPISCADATELSQQVRDWNFEFTQLSAGIFAARGGMVSLGFALIARAAIDQTLLHRGYAPHGSVAVVIPGRGSGEAFVQGRQLEHGQCVTMADGACLEAITRGHYVDVALAIDPNAWHSEADWLNDCALAAAHGTRVETPGPLWIDSMLGAVDWMLSAVLTHPEALRRHDVRASLMDHFLATLARFDDSPRGAQSHARDARAQRRIAVERARDYINVKLSEPMRLSELCRHAHVQARSLEYGFREITGLSPIAYIKSLRLNGVRKALLHANARDRSISEIALDNGFWHLSQFALDYRKFFGETPTTTRRRALAICSAN